MDIKEKLQLIMDSLIEKGLQPKYGQAGIYSISIGQKLVYIGKSRNMLERLASHIYYIENNEKDGKGHKYSILRKAREQGHNINFGVLYTAIEEEADEELGYMEGVLIRKHRPALNTQIPREDNWKKYIYNKKAQTITLGEILCPFDCYDF